MALATVTEYVDLPVQNGQLILVGNEPALAVQAVPFTSTAGQSGVFNPKTKWVRVNVDAKASFKFGDNTVTAVDGTDPFMAAGSTEFFGIRQPGINPTNVSFVAAS